MSTTPKEPEKVEPPKEKKRTFSSATGDKVRAEHRRVGLIGTLVAGALGGGAYGIHRSAEKFLPTEARKALEETERVFNRLSMSRALSGHKADNDDVLENYATLASRLSTANVAGMQGRELVKLLRSKLPVKNKWRPFVSDAHYDAFARGPAYGAAQLIDEHAVSMANRSSVDKKLKQYLVDKWPEKYSEKVNATALAIAGKKMNVGPSLRESLAYGGDTIAADKQSAIARAIIRDSRFNQDRLPILGGFSDHYKDLKKDLANGIMESSFPNYIGLGHKAKGVHSALKYALPALAGAAGVGVGGYGLMKLIKSMKRTPYEKRMMEKAEREGEDEEEKSASIRNVLNNVLNFAPKLRKINSYTRAPEKMNMIDQDIDSVLNSNSELPKINNVEWLEETLKTTKQTPYSRTKPEKKASGPGLSPLASDAAFNVGALGQIASSIPSVRSIGNAVGLGGNGLAHGGHVASHGLGVNAASAQAVGTGMEVAATGGHAVSHTAGKAAPILGRAAPVASSFAPKLAAGSKALGTAAAGLQVGVNAYQAGRMISDPQYRQESYNTQVAAANRGTLTSVSQATVNPAAAVYTAGKLTGDAMNSQADARNAARSYTETKYDADNRTIHRQQLVPDAQWANMSPEARRPVTQQVRAAERVAQPTSAYVGGYKPVGFARAAGMANDSQQLKSGSVLSRLRQARNVTHTHPTKAQAHAGNYRKGEFKFHGIKIKIENPKDTTRRGYKDGKEIWSRVMNADYGYFHGTKATDGDAVDCLIGPNLDSELVVAVDQYKGDKFDETKFVLGVDSQAEGEKLYLAHYPKGWTLGPVSTCTIQQLKVWLKNGNHKTPFSNQRVKSAYVQSACGQVGRLLEGREALEALARMPGFKPSPWLLQSLGDPQQVKRASDEEPSTIGKGLGTLFSDFFPYAPSGARRAGAASLMAKRIDENPGILLKYPMLSQVLSMMAGGALTGATAQNIGNPAGSALVGIAPWLAVQGLRRHKINSVAKRYKEKARKRLREIDAEEMVDEAMGSHRLGMAQAHEAMRTRKYRDLGSIAEAADTLPVATSLMGFGPAASLPLTQLIDHIESRKFIDKKADFSDQINAPAIPMYLAAAGLGTAGLIAASKKLHSDLNDPNLKNMPRGEWDGLSRHITKRNLLSAEVPGLNNAFFARARNDEEAKSMLNYIALHDPVVRKKISILDPTLRKLRKQVQEHGLMAFDPAFGKGSIVGHEAGHGKIEHTPGLMQSLQRNLYQYSPLIAPLSAAGGMAAGLATKNTLGGLLAGTGIGLIGGAGMMFPEYMATHHGMQGLKTYKGGKFAQPGDWGRQLTALGTYGALNVLPAALSGAFGGYVGGRRKKRREQAEAKLQEPDNVIRMDEDARKVEKAANLAQRFQQIQKLKIQAKALGSDYADKSALKQLGGYLKPSINQFFNNKEVQALGIKKGMKPTKILDILRNVDGPQA